MARNSKRVAALKGKVSKDRFYTLEEATEGVKNCATARI